MSLMPVVPPNWKMNTWSTVYKGTGYTLSEANLRATIASVSSPGGTSLQGSVVMPNSAALGCYWEIECIDIGGGSNLYPGLCRIDVALNILVGNSANGGMVKPNNLKQTNSSLTACSMSYGNGDFLAFAFKNGSFWAGKISGGTITWADSGNPAAGTSPLFVTSFTGSYVPSLSFDSTPARSIDARANFGQSAYAATPPAGFGTWKGRTRT